MKRIVRRSRFPLLSYLSMLFFLAFCRELGMATSQSSSTDFLGLGDEALAASDPVAAISYYEQGIEGLKEEKQPLLTSISLYTNLGTAFSSNGDDERAAELYRKALIFYQAAIEKVEDDGLKKDASDIAAQAAFFLGLVYQEQGQGRKAADAYAYANTLDPYHWSSLANLGSVLHDILREPAEALMAYNKAYELLTQREVEPTDAPAEPKYILSQLQYRIGLAIIFDPKRKCALQDDPDTPVSCNELAANAFSLAIEYDSKNEHAKHMLASVTADATVTRASNVYVKDLFDGYAHNFEHSLVSDLGYTGYERLRRAFDRAFKGSEQVPKFPLVIDAGCGTGLVGEQFRNVSIHLVGVDLSEVIIEEAKRVRPDLYDETHAGDVTDVFRKRAPISLIIAADSYIYFGDLIPLFQSMKDGLEEGGYVAFTLENVSEENEKLLQETSPDWRWQLTASGRFAHRKEYVQSVGINHDLRTVHYEPLINFRYENGIGVRGHIFIMRKESAKKEEL